MCDSAISSVLLIVYLSNFIICYNKNRFAMDVVGTVAFGLDVNTIENPNDPFRDMEKLVNNGEIINRIRLVGAFLCPK